MKFEEKICSRMNRSDNHCWGIKCAHFASCMVVEIESIEDLGINPENFQAEVVKTIEESFL